jgi:hypothetical protein
MIFAHECWLDGSGAILELISYVLMTFFGSVSIMMSCKDVYLSHSAIYWFWHEYHHIIRIIHNKAHIQFYSDGHSFGICVIKISLFQAPVKQVIWVTPNNVPPYKGLRSPTGLRTIQFCFGLIFFQSI